jgi:hypothetical protein
VQRCWVGNVCMYVWEHGVDVQTQTLWLGAESSQEFRCIAWYGHAEILFVRP